MKKHILFILLSSFSTYGFSQAANISPYSRYALGDINPNWFSQNTGIGGATVSVVDSNQVNVLNPASYSLMAPHCPVMDFSFRGRLVNMSTSTSSAKGNYATINNWVLGLPVNRRLGFAFGLLPYSSSGYNISTSQDSEEFGGTLFSKYQGRGGINRVFLGTGITLLRSIQKNNVNILSIGGNASYVFGDIEKTRILTLPAQTGLNNSKVVSSLYAKDFMFDAGIYYRNVMNERYQLGIGFATTFGTSLNCERSLLAYTTDPSFGSLVDTVEYISNEKGTIVVPPRYSMGVTYDFMGVEGSKNNYKLSLSLQYNLQDWTKYQENFASSTTSESLRRTSGYNFGVQYIPHRYGKGRSQRIPIIKQVNYRAGYYTTKSYLSINDVNVDSWGATAGFGIPLLNSSGSYSMINLGFEYGARGTTNSNLLQEKYWGFHIGVTFSPGAYDRWFIKRKYD
ncbi:MAG TPA: hypothetical protein VK177_19135 [Flavobacteriales bacterium]|nr:hypothetical protein [Flavobacteriales bacterium]